MFLNKIFRKTLICTYFVTIFWTSTAVLMNNYYLLNSEQHTPTPACCIPLPYDFIKEVKIFLFKWYYGELDKTEFKETECPICAYDFENDQLIAIAPCGHAFCDECIQGWLQKKNDCPQCRRSDIKKKLSHRVLSKFK